MSIPYRHQRALKRIGTLLAVLFLVFAVTWLCWVVWLQRYVVYTDAGAELNFALSSYELTGKEAVKPKAQQNISIFYNEGADAIDTTNEMTQLNGYYITSEMFQQDIDYVMLQVERFAAGTPVMIDMKGGFGSFFYKSNLPDAVVSASTNIEKVSQLITRLHTKGFYTIARISAFQDRSFGESHVSSGLYMLNRRGLWMDQEGMYWLDPTNATTTSWITSVVLELRELGFDEVLLDDFCFPNSDQYIFTGDKQAALQSAAATLVSTCSSNKFVLSFQTSDPAFILPEGRCRQYIIGISAAGIAQSAAQLKISDPEIRMVFLAESGDTRYEKYSVLRSLHVAEEVEARRNNAS
ncbi:MAG: hypothetical protein IIX49_00975 [Oscillospiraceae bacterium]|nr:hypothetical protein [Oscillospiraceae bacterium]